jgi:hypothetical protein
MGLEVFRRSVVERQRIDRETEHAALFQQPFSKVGRDARKMHGAVRILAGVFRRVACKKSATRQRGVRQALRCLPSHATEPRR